MTQKTFIIAALCATLVLSLFVAQPSAMASTVVEIQKGVSSAGGTGSTDLTATIRSVINILLFLIGVASVIVIIIAGFRFVTANGDSNTVSSARNTILYAVIGIVVAFSAYAIVNFVLTYLK